MTAAGQPLFSNIQLANLTMLLPADGDPTLSPIRIDPLESITQTAAAPENTDAAPLPVPRELENVIWKTKDKLFDLIPALFMDLILHVELSHRETKANAKLEASLKKKKTLDLAKILEDDLAGQNIVAPENMKELVNSLVDKRIDLQAKQKQKTLLQSAIRDARKKSSGGAQAAKSPPGKQGPGGKQRGTSRKVSFSSPPPPASKRPKKHSTRTPEKDYQKLERQRQNPNPYANHPNSNNQHRPSSNSGRGNFHGRGRGRDHSRGGYNNGRGRGHGRGRY